MLATVRADGRPRLVPITFAADLATMPVVIYSALDEKPKSVTDVHDLARVRDLLARPAVTVLVDRWSEDWTELSWVRLDGSARLLEPTDPATSAEHLRAVGLLRGRYPQYAAHRLEQLPVIRIEAERAAEWHA